MPKLIMNKGLPASGKSTKSREMVGNGKAHIRLNRDDIRNMLYGPRFTFSHKKEQVVIDSEKAMASVCLRRGLNVIIDDTNLSEHNKNMWEELAKENNSKFQILDFTKIVSVDTCIDRDRFRDGVLSRPVGRAVIERMALWNNLLPDLPIDRNKIVFFDLDGTLADGSHRYHYIKGDHKNWGKYKNLAHLDVLMYPIDKWFNECKKDYSVFIISGRGTDEGITTEIWLKKYFIKPDRLFMRRGGDNRDDAITKKEILDKVVGRYGKDAILFAVDDRPRVITMWRDYGIKVYPVNQANWEGELDV